MKIKLMNKIAKIGTDRFDTTKFTVGEDVESPDAIMVRSAQIEEEMLGDNLLAIARAGAGVNNIPVDKCAERGIAVFNTPGANANAVKELAICAILLAARDVAGGIKFAESLTDDVAKAVEKGKGKFAGNEILGKTLGVIGLGAIGGLVANSARALGMNVVGHDPYLTVRAAWSISNSVHNAKDYDEIYKSADFITLHVPSTPTTKGMINKEAISKMKNGVKIINLARADLVDTEALKEALESGKVSAYVTDFPTEATLGVKGVVNIPHLGASTVESEDNCAVMAANELSDYLLYGNIVNSVNYPTVELPYVGAHRICIVHKNINSMFSKMTSVVSSTGANIENVASGSRGEYAYTILELYEKVDESVAPKIMEIEGVIKVRIL